MFKFLSIILLNTKQGIREKTFWAAGLFFLFLLGFSLFLGELSIGEKEVVLRNVSLSAMEISCLLLVVFGLVWGFYREKDSRLKEVYLSYFSCANYLIGKLIGNIVICLIYVLLTSLIAGFILILNNAFLWSFLLGSFSIFLKLSIFCSICLLFSSLFDYPLLASISTIFAYVASELSYSALKIVSVSENDFARLFLKSLYHLLPNADKIDLKINAIYGFCPHFYFLASITLYVFVYILFSYFLTLLIFLRKEH